VSRLLKDPLIHFLLIGLAVFVVFDLRNEPVAPPRATVIEITEDHVARLDAQFRGVWRRPPTPGELDGLIDAYIREEILYREAIALGLDRDDTVIRQRLSQKMEFLAEPAADIVPATDAELRAFHASNRARYRQAPRIAFEQVFLGETPPGAALRQLQAGASPGAVGAPSLLPPAMTAASPQVVDGTFGAGFFDAVADLPAGEWRGPVRSGYGPHLVRVGDAEAARDPPFEAVRERVAADWRAERAQTLKQELFESLKAKYEIRLPDDDGQTS